MKPSLGSIRMAALSAADWYVDSQVILRPRGTDWDANAGRIIYNYHMPTRARVNGLPWSQARAIMVLMAAYRLTRSKKYLETAIRASDYMKTTQEYDQARPYFGAFHEEVPQSDKCWPRDAAEAASGFVHLYHETGDRDLLRRAVIYGNWLLSITDKKTGYPPGGYYFKDNSKQFYFGSFLVGCGMLYALLYQATGDAKWLKKGLVPLADNVEKRFLEKDGTLVDQHRSRHHTGAGKAVVLNDDGLCAALLSCGKLTGKRKYIDQALRIADWMMTQDHPTDRYSCLSSRLCFLMDAYRQTGDEKYRDYVLRFLPRVLALQVRSSKDPNARGGFRGEDEPVKWYVKGADPAEFVVNRVTAYAALTCFKLLNGKNATAGYSAFGWKRKPVKI